MVKSVSSTVIETKAFIERRILLSSCANNRGRRFGDIDAENFWACQVSDSSIYEVHSGKAVVSMYNEPRGQAFDFLA